MACFKSAHLQDGIVHTKAEQLIGVRNQLLHVTFDKPGTTHVFGLAITFESTNFTDHQDLLHVHTQGGSFELGLRHGRLKACVNYGKVQGQLGRDWHNIDYCSLDPESPDVDPRDFVADGQIYEVRASLMIMPDHRLVHKVKLVNKATEDVRLQKEFFLQYDLLGTAASTFHVGRWEVRNGKICEEFGFEGHIHYYSVWTPQSSECLPTLRSKLLRLEVPNKVVLQFNLSLAQDGFALTLTCSDLNYSTTQAVTGAMPLRSMTRVFDLLFPDSFGALKVHYSLVNDDQVLQVLRDDQTWTSLLGLATSEGNTPAMPVQLTGSVSRQAFSTVSAVVL